jgi:hypothetical protein
MIPGHTVVMISFFETSSQIAAGGRGERLQEDLAGSSFVLLPLLYREQVGLHSSVRFAGPGPRVILAVSSTREKLGGPNMKGTLLGLLAFSAQSLWRRYTGLRQWRRLLPCRRGHPDEFPATNNCSASRVGLSTDGPAIVFQRPGGGRRARDHRQCTAQPLSLGNRPALVIRSSRIGI